MPTVTLPNGTVLTRTSRADTLTRIGAIDLYVIEYNQGKVSPITDKRADCTGLTSYAWDTPDSGPGIYLKAYNTGSFYSEKVLFPIGWEALLPGDTIGYFAPTSPGNGGHAAIWMGGDRFPSGTFDVWDHGSGMGPKRRSVKWDGQSTGWLHPDHLAPWRYVAIVEDDGTTYTPGGDGMAINERVLLAPGNSDVSDNKELQTRLNERGADPVLVADGSYGNKTTTAVKAEQAAAGHTQTGSLTVKLWRVLDPDVTPEPEPEPEPGEPVDYDQIRTIMREELVASAQRAATVAE